MQISLLQNSITEDNTASYTTLGTPQQDEKKQKPIKHKAEIVHQRKAEQRLLSSPQSRAGYLTAALPSHQTTSCIIYV